MKKSQGFTLIELIAVIAILAILAATAIPQFVDLRTEARRAAANGVAGSLSSWSAMNYAKKVANNGNSTQYSVATTCGALAGKVTGVTVVSGASSAGNYGLNPAATALTDGAAVTCTLEHGDDPTNVQVTFQAIGSS